MKTIQLSERELSMIFSMLTPPYAVSDTHTDEFNELRNKVFYALRDAKSDEPVSNRDELLPSKYPVIPDGYALVPVEPTMAMLDEFDSIIDYGAEDSKEAWSRLIAAAPQQEAE